MILTKTQIEIMRIFTSRIAEKFSISQVSISLKKSYPMIHRSIKALSNSNILSKDGRGLLSLNYRENHSTLSYVESLRKESFLGKNKTLALFAKDALSGIGLDFFILLIFGSYAAGKEKPRDVDILLIAPDKKDADKSEKILERISSSFSLDFHFVVISAESAREMLSKRDKPNVINETLDNHIIIFGAENYYRLLEHAR